MPETVVPVRPHQAPSRRSRRLSSRAGKACSCRTPAAAFEDLDCRSPAALHAFLQEHGASLAGAVLHATGALKLFDENMEDTRGGPGGVEGIVIALEGRDPLERLTDRIDGQCDPKLNNDLVTVACEALDRRLTAAYLVGLAVGQRLAGR